MSFLNCNLNLYNSKTNETIILIGIVRWLIKAKKEVKTMTTYIKLFARFTFSLYY